MQNMLLYSSALTINNPLSGIRITLPLLVKPDFVCPPSSWFKFIEYYTLKSKDRKDRFFERMN